MKDRMRFWRGFALIIIGVLALTTIAMAQDTDPDFGKDRALQASITVSQTFDDNLFEEEEDTTGELMTFIRPQYNLFYPFRFAAVDITAGLPIYYYWEEDEQTDVLYDVSVNLTTARMRGFAIGVMDNLQPSYISYGRSEYDESSKNKVQTNTFSVSPSYQFNAGSRSQFVIRYAFQMVHFLEEDVGEEYYGHNASITNSTYLTPRIMLAIQYSFLVRDMMYLDIMRYTHSGRIGLQATWSRINFGVYFGGQYSTFDGDDVEDETDEKLGEYVELSFSWIATEWLTLSLQARRFLTDDVYTNTFFVQDIGLDFELPIVSWFTWSIGGYVRDYRNETSFSDDDVVFGGKTALQFHVIEKLSITAAYNYMQNIGETEENDFANHFFSLGLTYTF